MKNHDQSKEKTYTLRNFLPLIILVLLITLFTLTKQFLYGFNANSAMHDFMGSFFIIFGVFKIINLRAFAESYSMYDIIAKHCRPYAYMYPFIELILGVLYLLHSQLVIANWVTLLVMIVSSLGVAYELSKKRQIVCACLGVVFKIPMTYVTLLEDVIMGAMAAIMLIQYYY